MRLRPLLPACHTLIAAGALLGAALAPAGAARAEPVAASYEVYFGGLHLLDARAKLERHGGGYRLAAEVATSGFAGWLRPWKGISESRGRLAGDSIVPRHYRNRGTTSDGERLTVISYDRDGKVAMKVVQPEDDGEDRHPLPPDAEAGTLDPLSVVAGLSEVLEKGGRCEGRFAVFDGRKRYDLVVSDAGEKLLEPTSYSIYAGPARGCRLDYEMLGGHRLDRDDGQEDRRRVVWVASPAEGAPPIPVRLEFETAFGYVIGHLTGFAQGLQAEAKLTGERNREVE